MVRLLKRPAVGYLAELLICKMLTFCSAGDKLIHTDNHHHHHHHTTSVHQKYHFTSRALSTVSRLFPRAIG
jgi:hypothetical protein